MTDIFKGATSNSRLIELVDSTTGLPKTGIVYTDVTGSYVRTRSARVAITMATLASASAAFSSGGFILIDDTNQPGVYRVDIPDAAFVTGVDEVVVTIKATGCRTVSRSFDLVNINNQIAYVPNAAADAAGGLPISDAGGLDLDSKLANTNEVTTARMGALTDWIDGGRLDLILDIIAADTTTDIPALIATLQGFVDTEVAAIKAKTDNLPADPADASDIASAFSTVNTKLDTIDGIVDSILVDTNELQSDWVNGGRLDLILDARSSQSSVDDLPTNAELATALGTADDAVLTQVALVKAKTDNLPSDPADQSAVEAAITSATSSLATAANLATVAGYIDTEVSAIKTKTDQMVFGETNSLNVNVIHYNGTLQSNGDLPQKLDSIQSSVNTIDDFVDTEITAIKAKTDLLVTFPTNFSSLGINASGHISRVVLVDTTTTNADLVSAATIATTILTTQMTESYSADGVAPTLAQALFLMQQAFTEFVITGTGISVKKLDGVTEAAGYTMDSATAPTQRLRTS